QLVTLAERLSITRRRSLLAMANRDDLATRVSAVLDERQSRAPASRRVVVTAILAATLVVAALAPGRLVATQKQASAAPRSPNARPSFEVASIKPKGPFRGPAEVGISYLPGGRIVAVNAPVYLLIANAYDLSSPQVDLSKVDHSFLNEVFDIE